jgi:cell division septation protein DedD
VAELTHDPTDDGFHEIHLSGKQLVFLFMATTVVCVAIFLCGVLVGRGVRAERGQEPIEAATAAPASTASTPQPVAESGPQAAEPPAPASEDEDLSYHKRLEGDTPPKEDLKAQAPASKPAPAPAATPKTAPPKTAPAAAATATGGAAEPPAPSSGARPGTWVVQLVALRDRGAAGSIVQRLTSKGYPAFVVNPAAGSAAPVFKVQVGRYNDRREAEQVARRLQKEEQFNPWISR